LRYGDQANVHKFIDRYGVEEFCEGEGLAEKYHRNNAGENIFAIVQFKTRSGMLALLEVRFGDTVLKSIFWEEKFKVFLM